LVSDLILIHTEASVSLAFSAKMLLVSWQEGHLTPTVSLNLISFKTVYIAPYIKHQLRVLSCQDASAEYCLEITRWQHQRTCSVTKCTHTGTLYSSAASWLTITGL